MRFRTSEDPSSSRGVREKYLEKAEAKYRAFRLLDTSEIAPEPDGNRFWDDEYWAGTQTGFISSLDPFCPRLTASAVQKTK